MIEINFGWDVLEFFIFLIANFFVILPACVTSFSGTFHFSLDGHGYFYSQYHPDHSEDKEDWLDARNTCREYCMDLISLETPFENDMIEEFLTTSTFSSGIIP